MIFGSGGEHGRMMNAGACYFFKCNKPPSQPEVKHALKRKIGQALHFGMMIGENYAALSSEL